jgi:hypothetical protein
VGASLPDHLVNRSAVSLPPEQVPDWVITNPPSITDRNSVAFAAPPWNNIDQAQLDAMRQKLLESIWQVLVQIFTGGLLPGPASPQLQAWANEFATVSAEIQTALTNFTDTIQDTIDAVTAELTRS